MSNINHPTITLTCDIPAGTIRQYLWYVETSAAGLAVAAAQVDAEIAAGRKPTRYLAASPEPFLQMAPGGVGVWMPWTYPQPLWAFVVAESVDDEIHTRGLDVAVKYAGDGW